LESGVSDGQPITGLRRGDVAEHVFLCGDPARVERIAAGWKGAREVCRVREFRVVTGEDDGLRVTAASTGIGAPSTAVLVEELVKVGARTFLRVGNSGGLAPSLGLGDLVVTTGAVRDDGTSRSYVVPEYPALADHEIVAALLSAARERGHACHAGITWSLDAFYVRNAVLAPDGSMASMSAGGFWTRSHAERIEAMRAARVLNCEMEAGVLLTLAGLFGLRAGCICVVSDRTPWPGPAAIDLDRNMASCIEVARDAMRRVATSTGAAAAPSNSSRDGRERR
jgi:uridine phosphorylase